MRVGIIIYGLDRPTVGISRYTLELVRALRKCELCQDLWLLHGGGLGPLRDAAGGREVSLPGAGRLPLLMTWGQIALWKRAKELKIDVIHDPTGTSPLALAGLRAATVTTIHDVFPWSMPGYSSFLDMLIYRQWLPRRWAGTDAVITDSDQSRKDIEKFLLRETGVIYVIPNGASPKFRPLEQESVAAIVRDKFRIAGPYVLYLGALTQRKNVIRIIRAFDIVRHKVAGLKLVLAGPRSWKKSPVESAIAELGLADHIHLTGPLPDEELPALYNGAALFAFPSLYEGFGLPVLEAMACGTPVVTSNTSSLPEVAGDAALLVDPYDVDQIAGAMWRILSQPELAAALRQKGLARAARFTWERTARETVAVYERVLANK